jgi:hypothetical protein
LPSAKCKHVLEITNLDKRERPTTQQLPWNKRISRQTIHEWHVNIKGKLET